MELTKGNLIDDLERWIGAYNKYILTKTYSKHTLELYRRVLEQFYEYSLGYDDEIKLKDIKTAYIANFLSYLENNAKNSDKLSIKTKKTYYAVISSFFTYISDNNDDFFDFIFKSKQLGLKNEKKAEKLDFLNEQEITRLLNFLEKEKVKKGDYNSFRNSFLIKLMLFGGFRISEALGIKLCDLGDDDEMFKIQIIGKGGREQFVFVKKAEIIDEYNYFSENLGLDDFIFKTTSGKRLDRKEAFVIVNRIYAKALIKKRGLHILRHTLAMRLVAKNVNLSVISKILRHTDIKTTMIYAKATPQAVKAALGNI